MQQIPEHQNQQNTPFFHKSAYFSIMQLAAGNSVYTFLMARSVKIVVSIPLCCLETMISTAVILLDHHLFIVLVFHCYNVKDYFHKHTLHCYQFCYQILCLSQSFQCNQWFANTADCQWVTTKLSLLHDSICHHHYPLVLLWHTAYHSVSYFTAYTWIQNKNFFLTCHLKKG